jgi:hypothetical protein
MLPRWAEREPLKRVKNFVFIAKPFRPPAEAVSFKA